MQSTATTGSAGPNSQPAGKDLDGKEESKGPGSKSFVTFGNQLSNFAFRLTICESLV